ncbi:hypothetical protein ACRQ5Q_41380 (plasmid) [Bradyrhizobium sp. PMVTL-01]|uniref:hypothetical protein n=1 Tax=Bradyrhizobium sp. PMVTL-01 TaxID=3434999 RepID=UPI003F730712
MYRYVARANVDRYLALLNGSELAPHSRTAITKMLISEEDKLSHDLEHLDFAERRAVEGRRRLNHVKNLRESFAFGTEERQQADKLLVNIENLQTLLEDLCHRLRDKIKSGGL